MPVDFEELRDRQLSRAQEEKIAEGKWELVLPPFHLHDRETKGARSGCRRKGRAECKRCDSAIQIHSGAAERFHEALSAVPYQHDRMPDAVQSDPFRTQ